MCLLFLVCCLKYLFTIVCRLFHCLSGVDIERECVDQVNVEKVRGSFQQ